MAQTHYLEHTYQSDSCKKVAGAGQDRLLLISRLLRRTQAISLWSPSGPAEGTLPQFPFPGIPLLPVSGSWRILSSIEYALPAPSSPEPRPTMMYPAPQFSGPGPACILRAPICPPSAPLLAPAVAEEKETANLWAPAREGGA